MLAELRRPGGREIFARWETETPWRFPINEAASVAVGARGYAS